MQKLKGTPEFFTIYKGKRLRGRLTKSLHRTLGSPLMVALWWSDKTKTIVIKPGADFIVHGDMTISGPALSILPEGRYYMEHMEIEKNGDVSLRLVHERMFENDPLE